jgi:aspartyl-tRNA(Asn)/glutamyl-tRNA(Gln) amidotransferase subunit A
MKTETPLNSRDVLSRRRFLQMIAPGTVGSLIVSASLKSPPEAGLARRAQPDQVTSLTLSEAAAAVRGKRLSPVELVQACLARVERLNPKLNAFITITAESALAEARAAEAEIHAKGWRGPLHGIPVALKDLIDTAGVRTTAASALFQDRVPKEDAQVVRRLKAAGAVFLGKLNLHECAYGASGIISNYGVVRNPWDQARVAGGSSSGSAVAVATGMCFGAVGTDTGGSIRLPSSFCGTVGLKPAYGRVSCRGVLPLAWSLDHVGPMTRTVTDAALMLQVMAGYDPEDAASEDIAVTDFSHALSKNVSPLRLGLPTAFFADLDPEIKVRVDDAIAVLSRLTADIREVALTIDPDNTIQKAEAYANHADNIAKRPELYSPETLWRLRSGEGITAPTYIQARRKQAQLRREVSRLFANVDVLIMPAVPVATPVIAELHPGEQGNLRKIELATLRNTRPFNVNGLPTISVPCGFTGGRLPVGLQIAGPPWGEAVILRLAHAYEQATGWHKRHPELN